MLEKLRLGMFRLWMHAHATIDDLLARALPDRCRGMPGVAGGQVRRVLLALAAALVACLLLQFRLLHSLLRQTATVSARSHATEAAASGQDASPGRRFTAASAILSHIEHLQHPPDCRTAPLYVYLPTPYTSGLGSQIRTMAHSMLQAVALNRTFVLGSARSAYVHPKRCPQRTIERCLVLPVSSCTLDDALSDHPPHRERPHRERDSASDVNPTARLDTLLPRAVLHASEEPRVVSGRASCFRASDADIMRLAAITGFAAGGTMDGAAPSVALPARSAASAASAATAATAEYLHQWLQLVVGYVGRPSARVRAIAERLAVALALPAGEATGNAPSAAGYVGVHVRRGDKTSEAASHDDEAYATAVREALDRHAAAADLNTTTVLVASDDPGTYRRLPALLPPSLRVVSVPRDRFWVSLVAGRVVAAKMVERLQ